jgi:hypothetical protein
MIFWEYNKKHSDNKQLKDVSKPNWGTKLHNIKRKLKKKKPNYNKYEEKNGNNKEKDHIGFILVGLCSPKSSLKIMISKNLKNIITP